MKNVIDVDNSDAPVFGKQDPYISFRNVDPSIVGNHRVKLVPAVANAEQVIPRTDETIDFSETEEGFGFCLSNDMCAMADSQLSIAVISENIANVPNLTLIDKRRQVMVMGGVITDDIAVLLQAKLEALGLTTKLVNDVSAELLLANYTPKNITVELQIESNGNGDAFTFTGNSPVDNIYPSAQHQAYRFCISPHPSLQLNACPTNISEQKPVEIEGRFDLFIDDMRKPVLVNATIEEMMELCTVTHPKLLITTDMGSEPEEPGESCIALPSVWSRDLTLADVRHPDAPDYIEYHSSIATSSGLGWTRMMDVSRFTTSQELFSAMFDDSDSAQWRVGSVEGTVNIRYLPDNSTESPEAVPTITVYEKNPAGPFAKPYNFYVVYLSNMFDETPMVTRCQVGGGGAPEAS